MSQYLADQVQKEHPDLYQTNVVSTCYQATVYLLAKLRAAGHSAYHVCKKAGEGQYTPPGFTPREMTGFDGKTYICTGVSHDAIWCNGLQFDTIASGNDSDRKIYSTDEKPGWSFDPNAGPQITASAAWNPVPKEYWRAWNPPLLIDDGTVPPKPPEPPSLRIPSYGELGDDAFFRAQIGVPLEADMALAGQVLNNGSSVWFSRTTYEILVEAIKAGRMIDTAPIVKKYRNQWRAILGLPPL